jgi:hypothetical protein
MSESGTVETWRPALTTSVSKGRPEVIGRDLGGSITYTRFVTHLIFYVNPHNHLLLVLASAIAGAVLGGAFGFCLWRFDVAYPTRGAEAAT